MTRRKAPDGARQNGPALASTDRLQSLAYDVIGGLVEAVYNRDREKILKRVNLRLQKMRVMFRLASDL